MTNPVPLSLTEEEYLALEAQSDVRHEFVDGFIYAQAGASKPHGRVISNLLARMHGAAAQANCWVYASDMRVKIERTGEHRYYYPDLVADCENDDEERLAVSAPCLIVEVLSASTRNIDVSFKLRDYTALPSLQGYLVVDSERQAAELYHRRTDGNWMREVVQDAVTLPCLGLQLSLEDIYARTGVGKG